MRTTHLINLGYTPTEAKAVEEIVSLIRVEQRGNRPIRLFDPTCADGAALAAIATSLQERGFKTETFGVELAPERAEAARENLDYVLQADYISNTTISKDLFDFVLLNPPYDTSGNVSIGGRDKRPLEQRIISRAVGTLKVGGVIALVVPRRLIKWANSLPVTWKAMFETNDPKSPNQIVVIGQRITPLDQRKGNKDPIPEDELFHPVIIPSSKTKEGYVFRVAMFEAEHWKAINNAIGKLRFATPPRGEIVSLHPLGAGHIAWALVAYGSTIELGDGSLLRISARAEKTTNRVEDPDNPKKHKIITTVSPKIVVKRLSDDAIEELEVADIAPYAAEIAEKIGLRSLVQEDANGNPILEDWEAHLLGQFNRRLPRREDGKKGLFPAQAVRAAGLWRYHQKASEGKNVFPIMQMGFGKTFMSLATDFVLRHRNGVKLTIVMCPPHLVHQWVGDAKRVYPNALVVSSKSGNDANANIAMVRKAVEEAEKGRDVVMVMSREALKLSSPKALRLVPVSAKQIPQERAKRVWGCPHCHYPAVTNGKPIDPEEHYEKDKEPWVVYHKSMEPPKRFEGKKCPHCGMPYSVDEAYAIVRSGRKNIIKWTSNSFLGFAGRIDGNNEGFLHNVMLDASHRRRIALANVLSEFVANSSVKMHLIADEVHEYRNNSSLQGLAFSRMLKAAWRATLLTGTLFNGKASSLYWLLMWTSKEFRKMGMSKQEFVHEYGKLESVTVVDETKKMGRSSQRAATREKPGISPMVYRFLFPMAAFGSFEDLGDAVPKAIRKRVVIHNPFAVFRPEDVGSTFHSQGSAAAMQMLRAGIYANNAATVKPLDGENSHVYDYMARDPDGKPKGKVTVVEVKYAGEERPSMKERALLEYVQSQLAKGRKTIVFVEQVHKRPVAERLLKIFQDRGLRAVFLNASQIPAAKRGDWIAKHANKIDVLITHPKSVETGFNLVEFSSAVKYEVNFNVITNSQAEARIYRIGQRSAVEFVELVWDETLEGAAFEVANAGAEWARAVYGSAAGALDPELNVLEALRKKIMEGKDDVFVVESEEDNQGIETVVYSPGVFMPLADKLVQQEKQKPLLPPREKQQVEELPLQGLVQLSLL